MTQPASGINPYLSPYNSLVMRSALTSPHEAEVVRVETSMRTNRAARIAFITLGVLFAAGSVAIGFFALPLIAASIPLAIIFFIIAAASRPNTEPGTDFYTLRNLLRTNEFDLLHRYAKCCKTISLDPYDPQVKLTAVKEWILSECLEPSLKAAMSTAFAIQDPNKLVPSNIFAKWNYTFKTLKDKSALCLEDPTPTNVQSVVNEILNAQGTHWSYIQKPSIPDTHNLINIDSVPALLSGATNAKAVSLGKCLNPAIIHACAVAGVEEIAVDKDTPIFVETAKALVAMPTLKKLEFSFRMSSREAQEILEMHFRPNSSDSANLAYIGQAVWKKAG